MLNALAFGGLLLFLGTGLTPLLFQLPPARLGEWTAGTAGLVTGWWLGRTGRRIGISAPGWGTLGTPRRNRRC
jgi:hypothetical protein